MSQRIRRVAALFAVLFLPLLGLSTTAFMQAAHAGINDVTATTVITNDYAGTNANPASPSCQASAASPNCWAEDGPSTGPGFSRTLTVLQVAASVCQADPVAAVAAINASADICWTATISDQGDFTTLVNGYQPNQGFSSKTGNHLANVVSGTFSGGASWTFWAPNNDLTDVSSVLASLNDNQQSDAVSTSPADRTQSWYLQAFPAGTDRNAVAASPVDFHPDWSWSYTTSCNEKWTDSGAAGAGNNEFDGQSTPLTLDGNITGITNCTPPPPTDVVTVGFPNGNEQTLEGNAVSDTVTASSSAGHAISSFTATGLPPGLSIVNNGGGTATITGTPTSQGTFTVTVTATDSIGTAGSGSFTWTVTTAVLAPSNYGDNVNPFGNGFDVFQQHLSVNTPIVSWPVSQHDPATHFLREAEGGNWRFEYAPNGVGTGLCVSNPGNDLLVLRGCNTGPWQQFSYVGSNIISAINGQLVNPNGKGAQLTTGPTPTPWGGSVYHWVSFTAFPV